MNSNGRKGVSLRAAGPVFQDSRPCERGRGGVIIDKGVNEGPASHVGWL